MGVICDAASPPLPPRPRCGTGIGGAVVVVERGGGFPAFPPTLPRPLAGVNGGTGTGGAVGGGGAGDGAGDGVKLDDV